MSDIEYSNRRGAEIIPLFPLKSVLFPRGRLPLQIFEQRYINLIRHAMKTDTGFGICLLKHGANVSGGVWLPAAALGLALVNQLQTHAGLTFKEE